MADLSELEARAEQIEHDLIRLANDVWGHTPMLPACEGPLGDAEVGVRNLVQYLAEQKENQP